MTAQRLKSIRLRNFKRFKNFVIYADKSNILVGPNNAGKSSILDSLRILYGVKRYATRFRPKIISTYEGDQYGYEIPESSIPINVDHVAHNFSDDDAELEFTHQNGERLKVAFGRDHLPRAHIVGSGTSSYDSKSYFKRFPLDIVVVPTLSPFENSEPYISDEFVERQRSTRLSSRHFRNIWYRQKNDFAEFKRLVESTWAGVTIDAPTRPPLINSNMEMFFYEGRLAREIAWSGFGLQVWMQIITHLMRAGPSSIFVLDEPDVYLHPDMQRKLVKLISDRFEQYFLATHSTEIINEADIGDILTINSDRNSSKRIQTDSDYNDVYNYIGSIENVELAKLSRAKRVVFFEGKDKKLLSSFARKIGLMNPLGSVDTVIIEVGGFGQWTRVTDTAWTFKNVLQIEVAIFALFDRDYRDSREIDSTVKDIESHGVECAIWNQKEIENYALVLTSLVRTIVSRCNERGHNVSAIVAEKIVVEISDQYRHDVYANYAGNRFRYEQKIKSGMDLAQAFKLTSVAMDSQWNDIHSRLKIIPGKQFIAALSGYLQEKFGTSITANMLIEGLKRDEIDSELLTLLKRLSRFCNAGAE